MGCTIGDVSNWRHRARALAALLVVGVVGVVGYTLRPRELRAPSAPVERLDPEATVETRGGDAVQLKGTRQNLRIEFAGHTTYGDGRTKLMGVKLMIDNRGGRNYVITGDEAKVGPNNSTYEIHGKVKLQTSDGLTATAEQATYADAEHIVRAPGPVEFTRGRMSGSGIGFTYDDQRDTLWLLDQALVHFAAQGDAEEMTVAAGAAGFDRPDRYLRFERTAHFVRRGQVIDATEATVHLLPDRDEPKLVELRGDARISGGTGLGTLRSLAARDINLDYADDGRTLQQATLAGQAAVQLAAQDGSAGQRLGADWMDVSLAPDGAVTALSSRDNVEAVLPQTADAPPRTIRATSLSATGAAKQGLTAMKFQEGVEFREAATRDRGARVARARGLDAQLTPGSGALVEARFTAGFRFEDGALRASSADALYKIVTGELALIGKDGANLPRVSDERVTIEANTIDITLSPRKMVATGSVRTLLQPTPKAAAGAPPSKRPGLLGDNDAVNVLSEKLTYDEPSRRGVYEGRARLWQGDTDIRSDAIILDESKGDLSAAGKVLTTLALVSKTATPGARHAPTIARAAKFQYADQTRQALYETGAQMNGEQGDLHANRLALVLAAGENSLERLEAVGAVSLHVDKRVATGAQLTYHPSEEKYVLIGTPVSLVEECRESTGHTLTFFKSSDRVIIDGNEGNRTQTKGGKCPATPPS